MGIGELLGVKSITLDLKETYTLDELYEKIRDVPFDAGKPELVQHGFAWMIVWPQVDDNNQVQLIKGFKDKYIVQRSVQPAGLDKLAKNLILESATDGLSNLSAAFGSSKKRCMALTQHVADTINALGL